MTTTERRPNVHRRQRWEDWLGGFFSSSVGLKWLMAITGIGLLLYVLAHMIGNLKMFQGAYEGGEFAIDLYGQALRNLGGDLVPKESILWLFRIGLLLAFVIHIGASAALTKRNWDARGSDRYEAQRHYAAANYASRTMRWSGTIFLAFLVFHLADLTWGIQPLAPEVWERGHVYANFIVLFLLYHLADLTFGWANPDFVYGAVYNNVIASLTRAPVAILYLVAQVALAFHIYHGGWSLFQSLGFVNPRYNVWRRFFAVGFAALIFIGNTAIILAVWTGAVS